MGGGVDAVRGFNYQHCHALNVALEVAADPRLAGIRVEGADDVLDIEVHGLSVVDGETVVIRGVQVKSRAEPYRWAKRELLAVLRRWAALSVSDSAEFLFQTDGELGPSGRQVALALENAQDGEFGPISSLLEVEPSDPLCAVAARAAVVAEPGSSVESLLQSAEREVRARLEDGPDHPDAAREAEIRVNELWRLISTRSGLSDETGRFVPRSEILDVLGGLSYVRTEDLWAAGLSGEYVAAAGAEDVGRVVAPSLRAPWSEQGLEVADLMGVHGPLVLTGRTGSGKTTVARLWRVQAAVTGQKVVVCHAEAYIARQLDRVIADAVGDVVGRELPRVVGRQVLGDAKSTIVIDGVSEVPTESRDEMAKELRRHVADARRARLVLVGRDEGVCASLLPTNVTAERLYPQAFGYQARLELAERFLADIVADDESHVSSDSDDLNGKAQGFGAETPFRHRCRVALARIEHALEDAAGNPMLLGLALELFANGVEFTDRASVYEHTIDRMGARANAGEVSMASAVLGIMFGRLLDQGKRYAKPLEWELLFHEAVSALTNLHVAWDANAVREAVKRSGLATAVMTDIGNTRVIAPVHDSFADYFAAFAHAKGLISLPDPLMENDENRVLLSSQMRMLADEESLRVAQQLPFTLVRLSEADDRPVDEQTPDLVAAFLNYVLPGHTPPVKVTMWCSEAGRQFAQLGTLDTGWVEHTHAPGIFDGLTVAREPDDGPVGIATKLWRLVLRQQLRGASGLRPRAPQSRQEGCDQLSVHFEKVREAGAALLSEVAPDVAAERLAQTVGWLGATGSVFQREDRGLRSAVWPVRYRRTPTTDWAAAPDGAQSTETDRGEHTTSGDVESILSKSPEKMAAQHVTEAINKITRSDWL